MKHSDILPEKIKNYSLLAGSIIASSFAAQGQVIYTDVIPDKQLGGVVPTSFPDVTVENFDLNNDGTFDFKITMDIYGTNPVGSGYNFLEKIDGDFNPSNAVRTYTNGAYVPFAVKINQGDSIPQINFYGFNYGNFAFQFGAIVSYKWKNIQDKCVGLKFKVASETHYGWLRLDVNTATPIPNIIIKDF